MKHLFFTTLLSSVFVTYSFSQEYFPHAKGNRWVYKDFFSAGANVRYFIDEVGADTVMPNGKKYFHFPLSGLSQFARVDSNSLYFYNAFTSTEGRVFRFNAKVGDRWDVPGFGFTSVIVGGMDSVTIFSKKAKTIDFVGLIYLSTTYTFAESFGLIKEFQPIAQLGADYVITTLQGCIIDGVTYGNLTSVEKIPLAVPERVNLFPSYPNPFNGQTTIRFSLDKKIHLRLSIYDILGREIAVLIEKELDAGVYNTQWSAGNVGSSIYLVRLQTPNNVFTQKIIYMK
ncbi:MAG: T9SS type A sorting domain-containing protein [Ignavibacteriales bacterium]|nr:T9SS type A sorting domain-containing protein [Ignavibacteriales bacterium]